MRFLRPLLLVSMALAPVQAVADACRERIAAAFDGGPLDPRDRPPHRQTTTVLAQDGVEIRVFDTVMESALRSLSGVRGSGTYTLVIDRQSWTGPAPDGPWSKAPNLLPDDRMDQIDRIRRQEQANLSDTACPGAQELNGQGVEVFVFTTRTDPDPSMGDAWYGARNTVYFDPDTNRVLRWEMTDFRNSWSSGIGTERHVILYDYDSSIRLPEPE